jgi:CHAT domain-containing protein
MHQADVAMLTAGLALAGANQPAQGHTGQLSALELAGLDLWGTRLVVLSACDSGLGLPWPGEGVFGLRHALGLAGSQSQVMSLWKVDDEATRLLMHRLYHALRRGLGPARALREVQLHLMQRPAPYSHPFYWAGFVAAGADAPLPAHLFVPADGRR